MLCRIANKYPSTKFITKIIDIVDEFYEKYNMEKKISEFYIENKEFLQVRAIYFDDKHGDFTVYIDYIYERSKKAAIKDRNFQEYFIDKNYNLHGASITWEVSKYEEFFSSDHFDCNHREYYEKHIDYFRWGGTRIDDNIMFERRWRI